MPKPHRMIGQRPAPPTGTPRQHQQKTHEKQKLNPLHSAPHTKTRASPEYPANDRRAPTSENSHHAETSQLICN